MLLKSMGAKGSKKDFPDGTWRARVSATRIYKADDGKEKLVVVWSGVGDQADMEIADFISLLPQSEWRVAQTWEACLKQPFPSEGEMYDTDLLIDREAMIDVETRNFQGSDRKNVSKVRAI